MAQSEEKLNYSHLLEAGSHFGHLTSKWDPRMAPYIFMEKNGIHIIDLYKTLEKFEEASKVAKSIIHSGKKIMFVATKKQAKKIVMEEAKRLRMPFATERWLGGMLTNFATIRKSLKRMSTIERMLKDETTVQGLAKRERLMLDRERVKLDRVLGGVDGTRLPGALFIVDVKREHIAVTEARRMGIPIFALCDTNSNPDAVDYPIPANDDAYKSITLLTYFFGKVIEDALLERKQMKEEEDRRESEGAEEVEIIETSKIIAKYEKEDE